ncbi:MAG: hypothetical protein ACE5GW_10355, partial [Planctomycetota bacterium]
ILNRSQARIPQGMGETTRRVVTALILSTCLACGIASAQNPDYVLSLTDASGPEGSLQVVQCLLTSTGEELSGWSFGVCHEIGVITPVDAVAGATTLTVNLGEEPDFIQINLAADEGVNMGVVICLLQCATLSPGSGYQLLDITYSLDGPEGTFTPLAYCDTVGAGIPPVQTVVAPISGSSEVPVQIGSTVEIGGLGPFVLTAESLVAQPGEAFQIAVTLDNPLDVFAFSLGLAHDGTILLGTGVSQGLSLLATNGGTGPAFFQVDLNPTGGDGAIVGSVITLGSDPDFIPAGLGHELLLCDYTVDAAALEGTTSLDFTSSLSPPPPSPPTPVILSIGTQSEIPLMNSGLITIEPPPGTPFVRGDTNADGGHDLSDPVTLLTFLFVSGSLSCLKAADVNDTGNIDLGDAVYLLTNQFVGGPDPLPPFPACGLDPTNDTLTCDAFVPCP